MEGLALGVAATLALLTVALADSPTQLAGIKLGPSIAVGFLVALAVWLH
jgi:hypothetical protein